MTTCQALMDSGWKAPESAPDLDWDPASGEVTIRFGVDDESLRLNLIKDPDCGEVPVLGPILKGALEDYESGRHEECADAVQMLESGTPPEHGDVKGDLEALRKHVVEWCPKKYARQLD